MGPRRAPPRGDRVAFTHYVVHRDPDIRKGVAKCRVKRFERLTPVQIRAEPARDGMRGEHLVDRRDAALVPDFLKPSMDQNGIGVRHSVLPWSSGVRPGGVGSDTLAAQTKKRNDCRFPDVPNDYRAGDVMPQYLVCNYLPDNFDPSSVTEEMVEQIHALNRELIAAGARKFACGISAPGHAKSLRVQPDGKVLVTDGPYTETKEHMGGFWILECADLDGAMAWAMKAAVTCRASGEVRELLFFPAPD